MSRNSLTLLFCLALTVILAPAAFGAPCCQDCDGWYGGEPPIGPDYCWDNCVICGTYGYECGGGGIYGTCAPGQDCINGYCTYSGFAPAASSPFSSLFVDLTASTGCSPAEVEVEQKAEPVEPEVVKAEAAVS